MNNIQTNLQEDSVAWIIFGYILARFQNIPYFCRPKLLEEIMYAVVNIQGFQFKVEEGQELYVHRLPNEEGDSIKLEEVLLVDKDGAITVGKPFVDGASVTAEVKGHIKDDKVIVFKKKRRKGYRKKNGHRQQLSQIEIKSIQA